MARKSQPHHPLTGLKAKFASVEALEITWRAHQDALSLGYRLEDIISVIQQLEPGDFVKSETAHTPPDASVWHDTYNAPFDGMWLYLKFAGETLIDVKLTSFKEK